MNQNVEYSECVALPDYMFLLYMHFPKQDLSLRSK